METNKDQSFLDAVLVDTGIASKMRKIERERPQAALGNMKAHLHLEDEKSFWVSVGRGDLEKVLAYVETLEKRQSVLLQELSVQSPI